MATSLLEKIAKVIKQLEMYTEKSTIIENRTTSILSLMNYELNGYILLYSQ